MLYGLSEKVILRMHQVFNRYPEIQQVTLYGSRANGNFKTGSDIDITLKGQHITVDILDHISWRLNDLLLPYTIDLSIYEHIENEDLLDLISHVGVSFYKKELVVDSIVNR